MKVSRNKRNANLSKELQICILLDDTSISKKQSGFSVVATRLSLNNVKNPSLG